MAADVDIANLALSHLGDSATVTSFNPPEGSAQAEHCARLFPLARDTLLEMPGVAWSFATRRLLLAELPNDSTQWDYCYQRPTDCLRIVRVMAPDDADDEDIRHPFVSERGAGAAAGSRVIRTDVAEASLVYICPVEDTTLFSTLFVAALSHQLASMLAGPVLKGEAGAAEAKRQLQLRELYLSQAKLSDVGERHVERDHVPPWIGAR